MSKNISGQWVDAGNNPIANGRVFFKLSQDAVVSGTTQVAPRLVAFQLDINGRLSGSIWASDELTPSGTTYLVSVVDSSNALVYGQESFSLVGVSPININSLVPTTIGVLLPNPVIQNPTGQQTINSFDLVMENAALGFSPANSSVGDVFLNRQSNGVAGLGTSDVNTGGTLKLTAIQGPGFQKQIFTSSGTFTIPTGITQVKVFVTGGGGGGAGCNNAATTSSSGGGGGATAIKYLTGLTSGLTLTVTVGGGGNGGGSGANPGSNGVDSTVASGTQSISTITGGHGVGGVAGNANGGAGGTASGGDDNIPGGGGGYGYGSTALFTPGGFGGGTYWIGPSGEASSGNSGVGAANTGQGGGGAANNASATAGANGGSGKVLFEWVS